MTTENRDVSTITRSKVLDAFHVMTQSIGNWMHYTFGETPAISMEERTIRFGEEALELCQALGVTRAEMKRVLAYVYGRNAGEPSQEVAGTLVTLLALCYTKQIDGGEALLLEYDRINSDEMVGVIRKKQAFKRENGMTFDSQRPKLSIAELEDRIFEAQTRLKEVCLQAAALSAENHLGCYSDPYHATWAHFKGGTYKIDSLGINRDTGEVTINYQPTGDGASSKRPDRKRVIFTDITVDEWLEPVETKDATGTKRTVSRFSPAVSRSFIVTRDAEGTPMPLTLPLPA